MISLAYSLFLVNRDQVQPTAMSASPILPSPSSPSAAILQNAAAESQPQSDEQQAASEVQNPVTVIRDQLDLLGQLADQAVTSLSADQAMSNDNLEARLTKQLVDIYERLTKLEKSIGNETEIVSKQMNGQHCPQCKRFTPKCDDIKHDNLCEDVDIIALKAVNDRLQVIENAIQMHDNSETDETCQNKRCLASVQFLMERMNCVENKVSEISSFIEKLESELAADRSCSEKITSISNRLFQLECANNMPPLYSCSDSSSSSNVTTTLESAENRLQAATDVLLFQLSHTQQGSSNLSRTSQAAYEELQQQAATIVGFNSNGGQLPITPFESFLDNLDMNNSSNKFAQLQTVISIMAHHSVNNFNDSKYEELKLVVDALAQDSIPSKFYMQLKATIDILVKHSNDSSGTESVSESLKQQMEQMKALSSKLDEVEAKDTKIRVFLDTLVQTNDSILCQALQAQADIVSTLKREQDAFKEMIIQDLVALYKRTRDDISVKVVETIKSVSKEERKPSTSSLPDKAGSSPTNKSETVIPIPRLCNILVVGSPNDEAHKLIAMYVNYKNFILEPSDNTVITKIRVDKTLSVETKLRHITENDLSKNGVFLHPDGIMIVYNEGSEESFRHIDALVQQVRKRTVTGLGTSTPIMLVSNRHSQNASEVVRVRDARTFARSNSFLFAESLIGNWKSIEKVFAETVSGIVSNQKKTSIVASVNRLQFNSSGCKIVVVGNKGSGKTQLITKYAGFAQHKTEPLHGVRFCRNIIRIRFTAIEVAIYDLSGQRHVNEMYRSIKAALIVYEIDNRRSFDDASRWLEDIRSVAGEHVVIALVGCKSDLEDSRVVPTEEARAFADKHSLLFFETSARGLMSDVGKVFYDTMSAVHKKYYDS